jgi:hypothetical protein
VGTIKQMPDPEPHYAESFFVQPGRCFHLISPTDRPRPA